MTEISFDPEKREETLRRRGMDFRDPELVFAGHHINVLDDRFD